MISSAGLPSPPPSAMRSWFPQLLYLASPAWARPSPPQPWLSRGRGRWGPNSCGTTVNRKKKKKKTWSTGKCGWLFMEIMQANATYRVDNLFGLGEQLLLLQLSTFSYRSGLQCQALTLSSRGRLNRWVISSHKISGPEVKPRNKSRLRIWSGPSRGVQPGAHLRKVMERRWLFTNPTSTWMRQSSESQPR